MSQETTEKVGMFSRILQKFKSKNSKKDQAYQSQIQRILVQVSKQQQTESQDDLLVQQSQLHPPQKGAFHETQHGQNLPMDDAKVNDTEHSNVHNHECTKLDDTKHDKKSNNLNSTGEAMPFPAKVDTPNKHMVFFDAPQHDAYEDNNVENIAEQQQSPTINNRDF